jgi:hypothetical protein
MLVAWDFPAEILELLLALVGEAVGSIADFGGFLDLLVLLGMCLGVVLHFLDLLLREAAAAGDGNLLLLARAEIPSRDNSPRINPKAPESNTFRVF